MHVFCSGACAHNAMFAFISICMSHSCTAMNFAIRVLCIYEVNTRSPYHTSLTRFGLNSQMPIWSTFNETHSTFVAWNILSCCVVCMAHTLIRVSFCLRACPNRLVVILKNMHTRMRFFCTCACSIDLCNVCFYVNLYGACTHRLEVTYKGSLYQFVCRMHV